MGQLLARYTAMVDDTPRLWDSVQLCDICGTWLSERLLRSETSPCLSFRRFQRPGLCATTSLGIIHPGNAPSLSSDTAIMAITFSGDARH